MKLSLISNTMRKEIVFFFFLVYLFCVREKQSEQGRGREREEDRIPSRLLAPGAEPDLGFNPMNREIMT